MTATKIAQEADTMKKTTAILAAALAMTACNKSEILGLGIVSEELIIMVFAWGAYLLNSTGKRIYYPILGIY